MTDLAILVENELFSTGGMLPTPGANIATNGGAQHPDKRRAGGHQPSIQDVAEFGLFPTPRATRGGSNTETLDLLGTPRTANGMRNDPAQRADPHGRLENQPAYLQTPSVADSLGGHLSRGGKRSEEKLLPGQALELGTDWGHYAFAIRRHERAFVRPAPGPTTPNKNTGRPQLNPIFVEWMMGLPNGWVTDPAIWEDCELSAAGIRNAILRMLGNGVITQQAVWALSDMRQAFQNETRQAA